MADRGVPERLCDLCGIETESVDPQGNRVAVPEATRRALLRALGLPEDETAWPKVLEELESRDWRRVLPPVRVVRADAATVAVAVSLPDDAAQGAVEWRLELEDGSRREGRFDPAATPPLETRVIGGRGYRRHALELPGPLPEGYHRLTVGSGVSMTSPTSPHPNPNPNPLPEGEGIEGRPGACPSMVLIAVPERGYTPPVLDEQAGVWGLSLPLYALRSQRNWGVGDFSDLKTLVDYAADHGAALIHLNPVRALEPARSRAPNPYEPAHRLFFGWAFLDPEAVPDYAESEPVRAAVADPEFQARLRALRAEEIVDFGRVAALKRQIGEALYAHFREHHLAKEMPRAEQFRAYRAAQGAALFRQTLFDVLSERFGADDPDSAGWTAWPPEYRDPASAESRRFAEANAGRLEYYAYLYWQAEAQFEAAARRGLDTGLAIGLCQEFLPNPAADGAETWAAPDYYVRGVRRGRPAAESGAAGRPAGGGAPLNPLALREAAYAPFIEALRETLRHSDAVLIRDAAALWRQLWIPEGGETGGWVRYPFEDLVGIIALESRRHRCLILAGEGLLPEAVCYPLEQIGALPLRALLSESGEESGLATGAFTHCAGVVATAAGEPTLRGFWLGRDLDERAALGLFGSEAERHAEVLARAVARVRLLVALEREGLLPPDISLHPVSAPDLAPDLLRAVHLYLCRLPARIVLVRMEDALGQAESHALAGAPPEFPGWRRKLPLEFEQWRREEPVAGLLEAVAGTRAARSRGKPKPAEAAGVVFTVPRATYRLQFNAGFTFRDAADLVPYLHELGVSHCYASPYLKARPGSSHGYDIVDHGAIHPDLGSAADFDRFTRQLARRGMGHILDLVPNHMGVMGSDNAWWLEVLENGEASDYAGYFDIEWAPVKDPLRGKVLLPILGSPYGAALENGEIELRFDAAEGAFSAWYGPHRLPIDPREYPRILTYRLDHLEAAAGTEDGRPEFAEFQSLATAFGHLPGRWQTAEARRAERHRDKEVHKRHLARLCAESPDLAQFVARNVAEFNGTPGVPASFDRLHDLLEHQAYRLAYWRVAADEINYRRFFDINDLAALSMEHEEVFERTHAFVLDLIARGRLAGLRIDHPDGLYDPEAYFRRLQERIAALARPGEADAERGKGDTGRRFYVVAEKILEPGEELPRPWPVAGTTGYGFANLVNGLFVRAEAERVLDPFYRNFSGLAVEFDEWLYQSKRLILKVALSAELTVLAYRLSRIAESDRRTRDYSLTGLRDALREIIACFPVYRTYVTGRRVTERDAATIRQAVEEAKWRSLAGDLSVFDFIRDELLLVQPEGKGERYREQVVSFAMKFQQVTGPVMAKGMEDTAFYRYFRLVSLNEVGGDPRRFGVAPEEFHRRNRERAEAWPDALLSTSTHDTKRSEDVRARIDVITEIPEAWTTAVTRWHAANRGRKTGVDGSPAPSNNDEYLIYQTLVGTWPLAGLDAAERADYRGRLQAYLLKALREAKQFTSWLNPNEAYETATFRFLDGLLEPSGDNAFLADFTAFQAVLVRPGLYNALAQVLLKLTAPGVPDIYQGTELWDFSLVDPDNRRPVDYRRRRALVQELKAWEGLDADARVARLRDLVDGMEDGLGKLYLIRETLRLRQRLPELFRRGDYRPLEPRGERAEHVCAYARRHQDQAVLVAVPRFTLRLLGAGGTLGDPKVWAGARIGIPEDLAGEYRNVFTLERRVVAQALGPAELFARFPVALLVKGE
jgi:(1->4)-alpha-D-glucan 1-alpha-D-glucosylmutase